MTPLVARPVSVVFLVLVGTTLGARPALARGSGITGLTAANSGGCAGCHSTLTGTTTVVLSGPATLAPGATGSYTCTVSHNPAYSGTNRAGVDIGVKTALNGSTDAGTLTPAGSDLKKGVSPSTAELTQSSAKTMTGSPASSTTFAFSWTAPSTAGSYTMQAIGIATNGGRPGVWAWATPLVVQVSAPAVISRELLVPVVVDVAGELGTRFTTELALTNAGATAATARLTYVSATTAGVTGTITRTVEAGRQLVLPDVIATLRDGGVPVAASNEAGSLRVSWTGLSSPDAGFATARTTTPAGAGRAGLAYPGVAIADLAAAKVRVLGLRQNAQDRSNLAVVNAGTVGSVTLRVTLSPGETGAPVALAPDVTLGPGEWRQLSRVLEGAGLAQGFATVERVAGSEPFVAYGVVNDNGTGDGSYVAMVPDGRAPGTQTLPVVVETAVFTSDLVLANPGAAPVVATLLYTPALDGVGTAPVVVTEPLAAGEQRIYPAVLEYLRGRGVPVGPRGGSYAGSLRVTFSDGTGTVVDGFAGSRTSAPDGQGGTYGLFSAAVPSAQAALSEARVPALASDGSVRSNLALVNVGSAGTITLEVTVVDGATGLAAGASVPVTLAPGAWRQLNRVLDGTGVANGSVRVVRTSGIEPFVAYGVVNDNGTNDGSWVEMTGVIGVK